MQTHAIAATRPKALPTLRNGVVVLSGILLAQAALGLALQNGPFQDEATFLYAGRQYVDQLSGGPPVTEPYASYFAGLPYLQPLALGFLAQVGGVEAARSLSTALLLGVTLGVFLLGRLLFDERSGLAAAALFAIQAPVLFLGRLASYDAGCLFLLAFAAVAAVAAARATGVLAAVCAGFTALLLCGAFLVKYSALMFAPVVLAILVVEAWRRGGWRAAALRVAVISLVWALLAAAALHSLRESLVQDLWSGIVLNVSVTRIGARGVWPLLRDRFVDLVWSIGTIAAAGAVVVARQRRLLVAVLAGAFLIAPVYHLVRGEIVSLHKHVAYGAMFAAPLAGYALSRWWGNEGDDGLGFRRLTTIVVVGWLAYNGLNGARLLYHEWPDGTAAAEVLRRELTPTSRVLAEEYEIPRLAAYGLVPDKNWVSTEWTGFPYPWPYPASRDGATGLDAMREAIRDGWFDLIAFRYGPTEVVDRELESVVLASGRYTEIASIPYTTRFGAARYRIWKRVGEPSAYSQRERYQSGATARANAASDSVDESNRQSNPWVASLNQTTASMRG